MFSESDIVISTLVPSDVDASSHLRHVNLSCVGNQKDLRMSFTIPAAMMSEDQLVKYRDIVARFLPSGNRIAWTSTLEERSVVEHLFPDTRINVLFSCNEARSHERLRELLCLSTGNLKKTFLALVHRVRRRDLASRDRPGLRTRLL